MTGESKMNYSISFETKFVTSEIKLLEKEMGELEKELRKLREDILNCSASEYNMYRKKIVQKERLYQNMLERLLQIEHIISQKGVKKELYTTFDLDMLVDVLSELICIISKECFGVDNFGKLYIEKCSYKDRIFDFLSFIILERIEKDMFDLTREDLQNILDKYLIIQYN